MERTRVSRRIRDEMHKSNREAAIVVVAISLALTAIGLGQAGVNEWWTIAIMVVSIIVLGAMRGIDRTRKMMPRPPLTKPPGERRRRVAQLREEER